VQIEAGVVQFGADRGGGRVDRAGVVQIEEGKLQIEVAAAQSRREQTSSGRASAWRRAVDDGGRGLRGSETGGELGLRGERRGREESGRTGGEGMTGSGRGLAGRVGAVNSVFQDELNSVEL
jgi:hypothetical protein